MGPADLFAELASTRHREAHAARRRLQEVAEALRIGLVLLQDGKVVEINRRATELCPEDLCSKGVLDAFLSATSTNVPRTLHGPGRAVQLRRLTVAGSCEVILLEDVTSTLLLAERLKQSERLALLGQMSAQIAHQIKTPLAVLAGKVQLLARRLPAQANLRAQADDIYEEACTLARQINDILRFYRERKPVFQPTALCTVFADVRRALAPMATQCDLRLECPEQLYIHSDSGLLENLLSLLGQNALAGETRATWVLFQAACHGSEVSIRVRDNGCGIPASVRNRLFEPFVGTRQEGLGLGLFLASDLAVQLGGGLELEETQEGGTSFLLRLPRAFDPAAPESS